MGVFILSLNIFKDSARGEAKPYIYREATSNRTAQMGIRDKCGILGYLVKSSPGTGKKTPLNAAYLTDYLRYSLSRGETVSKAQTCWRRGEGFEPSVRLRAVSPG